jgi:hypothetical protein
MRIYTSTPHTHSWLNYLRTGTTIGELLETVFYLVRAKGWYNEDISLGAPIRVEEESNTSTVALRVVGGDEKVTQCLGV